MSEFKKNLSKIFKNSKIFTEQDNTEIDEALWDDIKDTWSKGKEVADKPFKSIGKSIGKTIANKILSKAPEKKLRVSGTGTSGASTGSTKAVVPKDDVTNKTGNTPPETSGANSNPNPIDKSQNPTLNTTAGSTEPIKPKDIPKNDDAKIIDPKSVGNIVHPDKPFVVLFPQGIELQGIEDPKQKEKKILNPIKNILKTKNAEISANFEKLKQKNNIVSKNSTDEISQKDPTDPVRKTILKDLFAIQFYNDAYKNLLKNLRDMNIISENKLDYGTFQQAINNAIETATGIHNRRYKLKRKKVNNLTKNEKEVKFGLRKGKDMFSKDMNNLHKSNKDKFTQPLLQEGVKYVDGLIREEDLPIDDTTKEDNIIRANDYVWWLDETALVAALKNDADRKLLTFKNLPIEFVKLDNGEFVDGTTAQIKYLKGSKANEIEKVDIRNVDIPQKIAKDMVKFGKVLSSTSDIDQEIDDLKAQLNDKGITAEIRKDVETKLAAKEKEKEKKTKGNIGSVAKLQKFIAKDINSLEKTIAAGKTKITPDKDQTPIEIDVKLLVKLNKAGKSKLLPIIGVSAIVLHSIFNLLSGKSIQDFLTKINNFFAAPAKIFGDLAGSKSETNF